MAARMGRGWQRQEVYKVEDGRRSLTAEELIAAALVLECSASDLIASRGRVQVGVDLVDGRTITDTLNRVPLADEGWSRFEAAGKALAEVRAAWHAYVWEMDDVRQRVQESPELRERIESYQRRVAEAQEAELRMLDQDDAAHARLLGEPQPGPSSAPRTPGRMAAHDALGEHPLPERQWSSRTRASDA